MCYKKNISTPFQTDVNLEVSGYKLSIGTQCLRPHFLLLASYFLILSKFPHLSFHPQQVDPFGQIAHVDAFSGVVATLQHHAAGNVGDFVGSAVYVSVHVGGLIGTDEQHVLRRVG